MMRLTIFEEKCGKTREDRSLSLGIRIISPGVLLASAFLVGFLIGLFGDGIAVCGPSGATNCIALTDLLAQDNGLILFYHAYWQFFTSIFVTDSALDAAFNAVAVLVIDRFIDRAINTTRYFAIFFCSAFLGNLFSLLNGPNYASAGASGGIFGLLAATFSFSWAEQKKIDQETLILFVLIFVTSSLLGNVDYLAHLGGSIGGFFAGPILYFALRDRILRFEPISSSTRFAKVVVATSIGFVIVASIVQFLLFVAS